MGGTDAGAVIGEYDVPGEIHYGAITSGAVTNVGAATVFATFGSVSKALVTAVPAV